MRQSKESRIVLIVLLLLFTQFTAGCAAPVLMASAGMTAARAGTSAFVNGELRAARLTTLDETWEAIHELCEELQIDIETVQKQPRSWYLMAREPGGPEVRFRIVRRSEVMTQIRIRIGFVGDAATSRLVLERLDAKLVPYATLRLEELRQHRQQNAEVERPDFEPILSAPDETIP